MTFISTLKLAEYKPQNLTGGVFNRRRKLISKIDQQIRLATEPGYTPTKIIWVRGDDGIERKSEVAKQVKRWWIENGDGTVTLTVRYGSKPLELAKGKNAIELAGLDELGGTLAGVKQAVFDGELDSLLQAQGNFGRKIAKKNS